MPIMIRRHARGRSKNEASPGISLDQLFGQMHGLSTRGSAGRRGRAESECFAAQGQRPSYGPRASQVGSPGRVQVPASGVVAVAFSVAT